MGLTAVSLISELRRFVDARFEDAMSGKKCTLHDELCHYDPDDSFN